MKVPLLVLCLFSVALFSGCATYLPPGAKADLSYFTAGDIKEAFARKPSNPFPGTLVVVRLQASDYTSFRFPEAKEDLRSARFRVITTREVETEEDIVRLQKLPKVQGVSGLNALLVPSKITSDRELREAAARIQGDLVLVYTFDTVFMDTNQARPLSAITLGLSPTRKIKVSTTISALLLDTRTGYIYATFENTVRHDTRATSWGASDKADIERVQCEREAFQKTLDEFCARWADIVEKGSAIPTP